MPRGETIEPASVGHIEGMTETESMDSSSRARDAARAAVADVGPPALRDRIDRRLGESPMTPGVLTRLAAGTADGDVAPEALDRRVAGVQLIYDGLGLTRTLARRSPWDGDRPTDMDVEWDGDRATDADVEILVADVLVARGFSLLARTEAAPKAIETVRAFGRDETNRRVGRPDADRPGRTLEADVFELGVVAGLSATGADCPRRIRAFAAELAEFTAAELGDGSHLLSEQAVRVLAELVSGDDRAGDVSEDDRRGPVSEDEDDCVAEEATERER